MTYKKALHELMKMAKGKCCSITFTIHVRDYGLRSVAINMYIEGIGYIQPQSTYKFALDNMQTRIDGVFLPERIDEMMP